jgi:uncharacterized protein
MTEGAVAGSEEAGGAEAGGAQAGGAEAGSEDAGEAEAGRAVFVAFTKYDGSRHWQHPVRYLGEDEHGIWLGAPAGTSVRRGDQPPVVVEHPFVQLIPDGQWWSACFNGEPADYDLYCDIGTPPQWVHPGEVTMADLDLDVIRIRADGRVLIVDEDEFAEHQVRYHYPADVIREAEQAAAWLAEVISAGAEPFATEYRPWLDQVS